MVAEAFQVAGAALACAESALRIYLALSRLRNETKQANNNAANLQVKVDSLKGIIDTVQKSWESRNPDDPGSRALDEEEQRIWALIETCLDKCRTNLTDFENDLEGKRSKKRQEGIRKVLLALELKNMDPVVGRFERNVDTHIKTIQTNMMILQTHKSDRMMDLLNEIASGNAYLSAHFQQTQECRAQNRPPRRVRANSSTQNDDGEPEGDEESESGDENEMKNLETLQRTLTVANSVAARVSRPPSSSATRSASIASGRSMSPGRNEAAEGIARILLDQPQAGQGTPVESDPDPDFDDTTPLEVLSSLIANFSRHIKFAMRSRDFPRAERYQLRKINYMQERKRAYGEPFDKLEAYEYLGALYLHQSKWAKAEENSRHLLQIKDHPSEEGVESSPPRFEPPAVDTRTNRRRAGHYRSLAISLLMKYRDTRPQNPHFLEDAEKYTKRAVKLFRETLRGPKEPNETFKDLVDNLLIRILFESRKEVEAETYRQLYSTDLEQAPPSPPGTPVTMASESRGSVASVSSRDRQGSTTSVAARVDSGVHVDLPDANKLTPLVFAIKSSQLERIHYLLQQGADVDLECEGKPPLLHAVERNDPTIVRILRHYRPELKLEVRDPDSKTPLALAAQKGNVEMSEALLEAGADIEAKTQGGVTPLMQAARHGHFDCVTSLRNKTAQFSATDRDGWTVLHHGVHGPGGESLVQLILNCGVDVNVRCSTSDETPLHFAVKSSNHEVAVALINNQADVSLKDGAGNSPLSIAVEEGDEKLVKLLLQEGAIYDGKISRDFPKVIYKLLKDQEKELNSGVKRKSSILSKLRS